MGLHYNVWFFVDADARGDDPVAIPPWYRDLRFLDPTTIPSSEWGRSHEEVAGRWLRTAGR